MSPSIFDQWMTRCKTFFSLSGSRSSWVEWSLCGWRGPGKAQKTFRSVWTWRPKTTTHQRSIGWGGCSTVWTWSWPEGYRSDEGLPLKPKKFMMMMMNGHEIKADMHAKKVRGNAKHTLKRSAMKKGWINKAENDIVQWNGEVVWNRIYKIK